MDRTSWLNSGRDLAGELVTRQTEKSGGITRAHIQGILQPVGEGRYAFLSGLCTKGAILVDDMGRLYDQVQKGFSPGRILKDVQPFFTPCEVDDALGRIPPVFKRHPDALCISWCHVSSAMSLSFEAFVSVHDPSEHPRLYLRWQLKRGSHIETQYHVFSAAGLPECWPTTSCAITEEAYNLQHQGLLDDWVDSQPPAQLFLPDSLYNRLFRQCYQNARASFVDIQPKYGHAYYGVSLGDHFPPNFLTMIEAVVIVGDHELAISMARYVLRMVVTHDGSFAYYGPAASEYGQLLWLLERVEAAVPHSFNGEHLIIRRMSEYLLSLRSVSGFIETGAEADTRFRVGVYMSNNLWVVRGLWAAASLLARNEFSETFCVYLRKEADTLYSKCQVAMEMESADTLGGKLPPFRLGYPALPYTLSSCQETTVNLNETELTHYLEDSYPSEDLKGGQELSENTYANYRYYLEMLSSRLLTLKQEDAIIHLRRHAGGEIMGMTRLFGWLDDWPVYHYARYLLESHQADNFQMLLHAHALFHGWADLAVYYEQVDLNGRIVAEDCVPSCLIVPLMLGWALVFEPIKTQELWLMSGAPKEWFEKGDIVFSDTCCRYGRLSISDKVQIDGSRCFSYDLPAIPDDYQVLWFKSNQVQKLETSSVKRSVGNIKYE